MLVCYQQCPQSINLSSILIKFEQQRKKKPIKKDKKKKKWATLDPSLHFGSPNHELSFKLFILVQTNWFSLQNDAI